MSRQPLAARFLRHVSKDPSGCWLWTASLGSNGYGQLRDGTRTLKAHRASWEIHLGPITDGAHVCHTCDVRACVNPDHLFLGTAKDNMADAARKGRIRNRPSPGSTNLQAKLTEDDVLEARRLRANGQTFRALAVRYGVDRKTITQAVKGERWTHV